MSPQPSKPMLFGFCESEAAVRIGIVATDLTAEEWHAKCPAAITSRNGKTTRCNCEHHTGEEPAFQIGNECRICGDGLRPKVPHDDGGVHCEDQVACEAEYQALLDKSPSFRTLQGIREKAEAAKLEQQLIDADTPATPGRRRRGGRCEHCGGLTAGGRFLPGHDAKLKYALIRQASDGDAEAFAELLLRQWPLPKGFSMPKDDWADGEAISEATDAQEWLEQRTRQRMEAAAGTAADGA